MSDYVIPVGNMSRAWLDTLQLVHERGGRRTNVLTTVTDPLAPEYPAVRAAIDRVLVPGKHKSGTIQTVDTVAATIFPHTLYAAPGMAWAPELSPVDAARLDLAAADLYEVYSEMLPLLCTADGNKRGTYFGRMVSWPGKEPGGVNQLADRVKYLRQVRRDGKRAHNLSDIAIGGEAEPCANITSPEDAGSAADVSDVDDVGLQVYAATDRRQRGFPCLVHVDLTLLDGQLSMLAVYRHQYLITKAYGNLLGLARLLGYLAAQTGFAVGELAVQATLADTQEQHFGGRRGIQALIDSTLSSALLK
ncbi:hypothetical protein [Umezawaea sp. Da 62-37]|uniref:hypothetical protein n=1 Tax=Umezawaea sp. Da 62-37 TaxID=3075927 RepID=UPI0028F6E0CB|nr:hypothetical protein [Umezawaea sp. Da 62-37]WNV82885.1 hypothetical protein RM788_32425 [Umezawaea sp. Da 62-37]